MRLGFSVATHVDGNIYLVDEAWSIGDASFQAKSIERLEALNKNGASLIIVSHDPNILRTLTNETLWLDQGKVRGYGTSDKIISDYIKSVGPSPVS